MPMQSTIERTHRGLSKYVSAFEGAWDRDGRAEPGDFLPGPGDPLRGQVLRELVRVSMGLGRARDGRRTLGDYLAAYPELAEDREAVEALAFEEYRLRRRAREEVSEEEYERRYGLDAFDWPYRLDGSADVAVSIAVAATPPNPAAETALRPLDAEPAARSYLDFRLGGEGSDIDDWCRSAGLDAPAAGLIRDLHESDPAGAEQFARAVSSLPRPGDRVPRLPPGPGAGPRGVRPRLPRPPGRPGRPARGAEGVGRPAAASRRRWPGSSTPTSSRSTRSTGPAPFQAVCMPYFGRRRWPTSSPSSASDERCPTRARSSSSTLDSKRAEPRPAGAARRSARPGQAPAAGRRRGRADPRRSGSPEAAPARRAAVRRGRALARRAAWPTGWPTPTSAASSTATSSRPTSC